MQSALAPIKTIKAEMQRTFRSLENGNFRAYFFGQLVSLCGTWMQGVALSWLVYRMSKSPVVLGMVDCAQLLPMLLFGLIGGAVADRFDRKKVLLFVQSLAMLQATILATLTLTHQIQVWHAIVLVSILGTLSAFEVPSRQALIVQIVGKKDLVNAISLNSSLFNGARAVGPALAAYVVMASSEGVCFAINAVSFTAAIAAIACIKVVPRSDEDREQQNSVKVSDALRFVATEPSVKPVILLAIIFSLFGLQYTTLMPIFAAEILHGDVRTLGLLRGAAGAGAVTAALLLASRGKGKHLRKTVGYASSLFSLGLLCFANSLMLPLSVVLLFFTGFGMTAQLSGGHSLVQLAVPDRLRGRVMSIYMMVVLGFAPFGSLFVGNLAAKCGAPFTLSLCALCCLSGSVLYLWNLRKTCETPAPKDETLANRPMEKTL